MRKYNVRITEDERHVFRDEQGREIRVGLLPKEPFHLASSKFKIKEVLWENPKRKELWALLSNDDSSNIVYSLMFDDFRSPPSYVYCFARFLKVGKGLVAEIFTCGKISETARMESYPEEDERYFELCTDDCQEDNSVWVGKVYTDYFDGSFFGESGPEKKVLLSIPDVDGTYSAILDLKGRMVEIDADFDNEKWRNQCVEFKKAYGVFPKDIDWQIYGRPVIYDNGDKIRMMLGSPDFDSVWIEVFTDKKTWEKTHKWKIRNFELIFFPY
ncbi:hypothetical protein IJ076_01855 [Candidatus Saccharibacteria bacterium]|nr:hypothetical protein [Candidatus Saccharibacteria bacterium]